MDLRQRKKPGPDGEHLPEPEPSAKRSETIDKTFTRLIGILVTLLVILLSGLAVFPDHQLSVSTLTAFDQLLNTCGLSPKVTNISGDKQYF